MQNIKIVLLVTLIYFVSSELIIKTKQGLVRGIQTPFGRQFLGIPYAQPPIGNLRFAAPEPPKPWKGIYDATKFGNSCIQYRPIFTKILPDSEDCLFLNVFVPNKTSIPKKVIVYIHGGGFNAGGSIQYPPTQFVAEQDVIFVTVNYRLGAFGFLKLESWDNSGNFAIQDQRMALLWVKENIQSFGGDPNDITLFGESAGMILNLVHLVSKKSNNLFQKMILHSGYIHLPSKNKANMIGKKFIREIGCEFPNLEEILKCLRSQPTNKIRNTLKDQYWEPSINGIDLTDQPIELLTSGHFNQVPILIGTNLHENSYWICPNCKNVNSTRYERLILDTFPKFGNEVLKLYPISKYGDPLDGLVDIFSDLTFKCPTLKAAKAIQSYKNVYMYSFEFIPKFGSSCYKAAHAFELPFFFPDWILPNWVNHTFTKKEQELAVTLRHIWANFTKYGNPNPINEKEIWKPFGKESNYLVIHDKFEMKNNFRQSYCHFWESKKIMEPIFAPPSC